jgi:hypothetical protein
MFGGCLGVNIFVIGVGALYIGLDNGRKQSGAVMKYEYQILRFEIASSEDLDEAESIINLMGEKGWKLMGNFIIDTDGQLIVILEHEYILGGK